PTTSGWSRGGPAPRPATAASIHLRGAVKKSTGKRGRVRACGAARDRSATTTRGRHARLDRTVLTRERDDEPSQARPEVLFPFEVVLNPNLQNGSTVCPTRFSYGPSASLST